MRNTNLLLTKIQFPTVTNPHLELTCLSPVVGNLMVMLAVLRRAVMRTARNIFIFNLALSDLLFAVTIPFTVIDALNWAWPLPNSPIVCR